MNDANTNSTLTSTLKSVTLEPENFYAHEIAPISLWDAVLFWFALGWISFGGPAGQISTMHQELVERRKWISEKRFLHALNFCMLLPGPEAQQLATYIGWLMHKTKGGIIAGVLFVLPSLLILIILSWVYIAFGHLTWIAGIFYGIKPAVTAIVLHAAYRIGSKALKTPLMWCIAAAALISIFAFHVPFPLIVFGAACIGYFAGKWAPQQIAVSSSHQSKVASYGKAWIDDDTPIPKHAKFTKARFLSVLLIGVLLWCIPMGILMLSLGWQHTYTQMAWFFTKAAFLTFGGAYAVLPYVYQGAVDHYAWLTPTQMIDGLALGETTPGPLIMVVAFVGFIGAYVKQVFGIDHVFLAGALAACLVTWFTFLPSFIFILLGGPMVEATHNDLQFTAPLSAITAAVVGVIVNLAIFFALHVFWKNGLNTSIDVAALSIALMAIIGLMYFKRSVIQIIVLSAILGFLIQFLS